MLARMIWKFYAVSAALSWSKRASVAEDLALVLPILILGLLFFRMPFDEVAGIFADAVAIRQSSPTRTAPRLPTFAPRWRTSGLVDLELFAERCSGEVPEYC